MLQTPVSPPNRPHMDGVPASLHLLNTVAEDVRGITKTIMKEFEIPGAIVSVRVASEPVVEFAMGSSTRQDEHEIQPMLMDYSFRIGSVTKSMTATVILLLIQDNYLGLNDTIDHWFPQYPNAKKITIRYLLNMTSGLGDYENTDKFERIFAKDPLLHWNTDDLVRWARDAKPNFNPGEGWKYCNTNYVLLGRIIEQIMQLPLHDVFESILFRPLGMQETFLATDGEWRGKSHARGYGVFRAPEHDIEDCTAWNPTWGWSAGGVISNVEDMHRWAVNLGHSTLLNHFGRTRWLLNPMLDQSAISVPVKNRPAFEENVFFYAFGVVFDEGWVYHSGSIPGFETMCAHHPELGISIVLSVNQTTLPKFNAGNSSVMHLFKRIARLLTVNVPPLHID